MTTVEAQIDDLVEFYNGPEFANKLYIGKIKNVSHKYLTVFHIIPANGFEDHFPDRDPKLVIVTNSFIIRKLNPPV